MVRLFVDGVLEASSRFKYAKVSVMLLEVENSNWHELNRAACHLRP